MRLNKVEFHEKKIGKKKSNVLLIDSTPSFFLSVIVQFIYLFIYFRYRVQILIELFFQDKV